MDKEIKNNYNDALFNLEQVLQSIGIDEPQQELLTKCLAAFGEAFDNIISWCNILDKYASRLDNLGETDTHTGPKTLEYRLDMIEGSLDIFSMSHLGHTNTSSSEFKEMHGFEPLEIKGDILQCIEGMQKKIDRITQILEKYKITMSVKDALKL